ncbi:MAG: hypothetical protein K0S55_682 [Clostridia bacterium]|nr:hypothetical protein [Clostridia bacterium]
MINIENTQVNIYDSPAIASLGIGTIEIVATTIAFLINLTKPLEKSNKGFFIGYAAVNDVIAVGMAFLLAVVFIIFGIVIIRWGIYGLKSNHPVLAIIGICQGSLSILIDIISLFLIAAQTIEMYDI